MTTSKQDYCQQTEANDGNGEHFCDHCRNKCNKFLNWSEGLIEKWCACCCAGSNQYPEKRICGYCSNTAVAYSLQWYPHIYFLILFVVWDLAMLMWDSAVLHHREIDMQTWIFIGATVITIPYIQFTWIIMCFECVRWIYAAAVFCLLSLVLSGSLVSVIVLCILKEKKDSGDDRCMILTTFSLVHFVMVILTVQLYFYHRKAMGKYRRDGSENRHNCSQRRHLGQWSLRQRLHWQRAQGGRICLCRCYF